MSLSDKELPTGRQIAAARTLLGMSQSDLAGRSSISTPTLKRMEASEGPAVGFANNVLAVRRALEAAGVEFTNGGQPGVRLRKQYEGGDIAKGMQYGPVSAKVGKDHTEKIITEITVVPDKRR